MPDAQEEVPVSDINMAVFADFFADFLKDCIRVLLELDAEERSLKSSVINWRKINRAFACRFSFTTEKTRELMKVLEMMDYVKTKKHGVIVDEGVVGCG